MQILMAFCIFLMNEKCEISLIFSYFFPSSSPSSSPSSPSSPLSSSSYPSPSPSSSSPSFVHRPFNSRALRGETKNSAAVLLREGRKCRVKKSSFNFFFSKIHNSKGIGSRMF